MASYSAAQGRTPVSFGATDLVCCRTLQGHTGKVTQSLFISSSLSFKYASLWSFVACGKTEI